MQAVIELVMAVMSALTLAILAQLGVDAGPSHDAHNRPQTVVARSPRAEADTAPQHATDCPQAPPPRAITV